MAGLMGAGLGFLGGSLLSGGGGGKTTGQGTAQMQNLTPEQYNLLEKLSSMITPQIGAPGNAPPSSMGPLGPSSLQQQSFNFAQGLPGYFSSPAFGEFNPFNINAAMQPVGDYARQGFQQQTIPAIMAALGSQGSARSSGAANILGREGRNLEMGLASQFAPMQYQGLQDQLNRQAQLPGLASQMSGQLANIGSLQRSIPGEQQQYELSRWQAQQPWQNPAMNFLGPALGTSAFTNIGFQGTRQPSLLESLIPAAGGVLGGMFGGGYL